MRVRTVVQKAKYMTVIILKLILFQTPILRRAEGMLAQSVILDLAKGDQVQVFAYHGNLRDGGWHYTHFNGFLIQ